MDDQGCPRCKTTKYRNPSLKLMVNICGHSLCDNCVDLLFIKGSGACPECGTALRRSNFRLQLFEDPAVEKEVDIRKRILRDFNKKEEDFETLREYNDYLEMIETIVFNLYNNVDVESTRKMIETYKKENKEFIQKNKSKLSKDEEYLEMLIEHERQEAELHKQALEEEEKKEKSRKKKNKEALIDELMFSDLPAADIMAVHIETTKTVEPTLPKAATEFSTGIKMGFKEDMVPLPKQVDTPLYTYSSVELEACGPDLPTATDVMSSGFLVNVREASDSDKGGGFESKLACHRALQEALVGLFFYTEFPVSMSTDQHMEQESPT